MEDDTGELEDVESNCSRRSLARPLAGQLAIRPTVGVASAAKNRPACGRQAWVVTGRRGARTETEAAPAPMLKDKGAIVLAEGIMADWFASTRTSNLPLPRVSSSSLPPSQMECRTLLPGSSLISALPILAITPSSLIVDDSSTKASSSDLALPPHCGPEHT